MYSRAAGGECDNITIESNVDWKVNAPDWVRCEPEFGFGSGSFTVYTDKNTVEERKGQIVVSADGCDSIYINITQASGITSNRYIDDSLVGMWTMSRFEANGMVYEGDV